MASQRTISISEVNSLPPTFQVAVAVRSARRVYNSVKWYFRGNSRSQGLWDMDAFDRVLQVAVDYAIGTLARVTAKIRPQMNEWAKETCYMVYPMPECEGSR